MNNIKRAGLLLALCQLASCAVMSKQECLSADWKQVGYEVGLTGDTNKSDAFNAREQMCSQYGESADSTLFDEGHANGVVEYCQLSNAVELGVDGADNAITSGVCPHRDYPGFRRSFEVGYQLYTLRSRAKESGNAMASLNSQANRAQQEIRLLNRQSGSQDIDNSLRKQLSYEYAEAANDIERLERQIEELRRRQAIDQSAARDYAEYIYEDYLVSLSGEFVDPRNNKKMPEVEQSEFDDRINDVLNELDN